MNWLKELKSVAVESTKYQILKSVALHGTFRTRVNCRAQTVYGRRGEAGSRAPWVPRALWARSVQALLGLRSAVTVLVCLTLAEFSEHFHSPNITWWQPKYVIYVFYFLKPFQVKVAMWVLKRCFKYRLHDRKCA